MMIPVVVVAGATASGKTALSIELAKRLDGEIVSCDSMQIYKGMDIGTAKPTKSEMDGIPHYMIDILNPDENFSVAEFCDMARKIISDIQKRGKLPILVGGTGLYIDSLINNIEFSEEIGKDEVREELFELAEKEGNDAVYNILLEIDPEYAEKVHKNNLKRVIRAIELYRTTGMTVTEHNRLEKTPIYNSIYFCINWDRDILYERINKRVDLMISSGLEAEAKRLYDSYGNKKLTSLQSIGYKEFFDFFEGKISLNDAIDEIKQNSRRYAKRQLTWFRRNSRIHWLSPDEHTVDNALEIITKSLTEAPPLA